VSIETEADSIGGAEVGEWRQGRRRLVHGTSLWGRWMAIGILAIDLMRDRP
jgi:hypothetical protein